MSWRLVHVCEGRDFGEVGSVELFEKLRAMVSDRDPKEQSVRVRNCPCLGGRKHGINLTVWPDRVFYSRVDQEDLVEIVAHLLHGNEPGRHLL